MDSRARYAPTVEAADQDGYDGGYCALHQWWSAWGRTREEAREALSQLLSRVPVKKPWKRS
jgi:predicted RNase H-like HicB family nuclease